MKTKIKNLSSTQVELEVELPADKFDRFIDKAVSSLAKEMKLPGFRQGKIPKQVVMKEAGQSTVLMEAAKLAVNDVYRKAILDNDLEPISPPKVDILKLAPQNPFSFRATLFVLPKFELPNYRELASGIKKEKISVKEKEIKDVLGLIQRSRADLKEVFRPAQKDDYVEIEFSCPQIKNNLKQKDAFVLGKGHLIPGFENQLLGMSAGEEKTFSLDFPSDFYQKELAGQPGDFQVKMTSVKEVELAEINDQFAQKVGNFKNLKEL
jgi:trigger factor